MASKFAKLTVQIPSVSFSKDNHHTPEPMAPRLSLGNIKALHKASKQAGSNALSLVRQANIVPQQLKFTNKETPQTPSPDSPRTPNAPEIITFSYLAEKRMRSVSLSYERQANATPQKLSFE